jgi:hypothetical protein
LDIVQHFDNEHKSLYRNANAKLAYVISFYLLKLIEQYDQEFARIDPLTKDTGVSKESAILVLLQLNSTNLNGQCQKLMTLLRSVFLAEANRSPSGGARQQQQLLTMKNFDLFASYTQSQYLGFFNYESDKRNLFTFLFGLFKTLFAKAGLLNARKNSLKPAETTTPVVAVEPATAKPVATDIEIKNIDDSSSDTEQQVAAAGQTAPAVVENGNVNEDTDDYLLIGSWFDEQLSAPSGKSSESTLNTGDANSLITSNGVIFEAEASAASAANKNSFSNVNNLKILKSR